MGILQSKLFANDERLEACAIKDPAHLTPGTVGSFVAKVQSALQLLENAAIDQNELKAQLYGPSTAKAVLSFKQKRSIINPAYQKTADNIVGKMTIARLDAEMVEFERRIVPPTPPTPPPKPLDVEEAKRAIAAYLRREAKHNVAEILLGQSANLLVFGEIHDIGDAMKAFLFAELIGRVRIRRPVNTHFHASERFMNKPEIRQQISDVLQASPFGMDKPMARLDGSLRPFIPVLAAANSYPGRRFGVIPSDDDPRAPEDQRHKSIFNAFNDAAARCPDVPQRSIQSAVSRGHFLLGARHAARRSIIGSATATTAQRLESAGWRIHVIRLTDLLELVKNPDSMRMRLIGGNDKQIIDGLSLIDGASNRNYYADITKPDSPFARLKLVDSGAHDIPVSTLFDAIVHLGGPASV